MDLPETALDTQTRTLLLAVAYCKSRQFMTEIKNYKHEYGQIDGGGHESYICECKWALRCAKWKWSARASNLAELCLVLD